MKKVCVILVSVMLLSGCAATETFETVDDELVQSAMSQSREIVVTVPENASTAVMEAEDGSKLYLCDGYTMTVQTLKGGDMAQTVRTLCGYNQEALTVMQIRDGTWKRHEWVWICAGEGGEQLGRAAVLDDGTYHYCLTLMAEATDAAALEPEWEAIFTSFTID